MIAKTDQPKIKGSLRVNLIGVDVTAATIVQVVRLLDIFVGCFRLNKPLRVTTVDLNALLHQYWRRLPNSKTYIDTSKNY